MRPIHICALLALTTAALASSPARAAASYDNCIGYIDTVPATLTLQGTYCLRKDLASSLASGTLITIGANNITIDCNDFKIGGISAGVTTRTVGIGTTRTNATIRNCSIRGFYRGINLVSPGALVENNRFDGNTFLGISVGGDGAVIRGNRVLDTGGTDYVWPVKAVGIYTEGDVEVLGNMVSGVFATPGVTSGKAFGINAIANLTGSVIDNQVKGVVGNGAGLAGEAHAISFYESTGRVSVDSNNLVGTGATNTIAVYCPPGDNQVVVTGNVANGWDIPAYGCEYDGGNVVFPLP